jgi:formylglycine-generating enzyme required for sulfatase activity
MAARKEIDDRRARECARSDDHPVASISWEDVREYRQWFRRTHGVAMRLPFEAEWGYASRGVSGPAGEIARFDDPTLPTAQ